jgi:hypothetical protein
MTPSDHRSTCAGRSGGLSHRPSCARRAAADAAQAAVQAPAGRRRCRPLLRAARQAQPPPPPPAALARTVWLYGCSCTSSGAMYSGVPLMLVSTMVLLDMARAKPKSQSLTMPLAPIRMFCGFMSRWMILRRRQAAPSGAGGPVSRARGPAAAACAAPGAWHAPGLLAPGRGLRHHRPPPRPATTASAPVGVQVVQRAHELLGDRLHHVLGQALVVLQDLKQLALGELCGGAGGRAGGGGDQLSGGPAGSPRARAGGRRRSPPVTTTKSVLVSNESSIWMMFSCFSCRRISISWRRLRMSFSLLPALTMNFIAVIWPVHFLRPLNTCGAASRRGSDGAQWRAQWRCGRCSSAGAGREQQLAPGQTARGRARGRRRARTLPKEPSPTRSTTW